LDLDGAQALATYLVDAGNDGLVISGTTGESATTTEAEKDDLLRAVVEAVGDRCSVVAGVGTNDTAASVERATAATKIGAAGLLAVTPYYNRPPQAGVIAHLRAVADASELPVMLYDIPARTGLALETETLVRLAEHPRIVAVKDSKFDLEGTSWVLSRTDLAVYSGDDRWTLPLLALGGVGVVGTSTHLVAARTGEMIAAFLAGDVTRARELHESLLPLYSGIFRAPGTIMVKAALRELGLPGGPVRLPLVDATPEQLTVLVADCAAAGSPLVRGAV
jgi:4-hydroxy-tetrahydrodipicolinate synthase